MILSNILWKIYTGLFICVQIIKASQQNYCSRYQYLQPGDTYKINNVGYPDRSTGYNCTFTGEAPQYYNAFVDCTIDFKTDGGTCGNDIFYISLDGNADLSGAEIFCGSGMIQRASSSSSIVVSSKSPGPRALRTGNWFFCFVRSIPDCGWMNIDGRKHPHEGQYPSLAAIVKVKGKSLICGGTIISHYLVVSAKHCFEENADVSAIGVVVGIGSKNGVLYRIQSILFPPENNNRREPNDIALLKTFRDIRWSAEVGPACLPFLQRNNTFADKDVILLGWPLDGNSIRDTEPQKVQAKVISNSNCSSYYPSISANQMCTFAPGNDACQMGSGGPVLYIGDRQFLVGVISYDSSCGEDNPGVTTRITSYLDWIESVSRQELSKKTFD